MARLAFVMGALLILTSHPDCKFCVITEQGRELFKNRAPGGLERAPCKDSLLPQTVRSGRSVTTSQRRKPRLQPAVKSPTLLRCAVNVGT